MENSDGNTNIDEESGITKKEQEEEENKAKQENQEEGVGQKENKVKQGIQEEDVRQKENKAKQENQEEGVGQKENKVKQGIQEEDVGQKENKAKQENQKEDELKQEKEEIKQEKEEIKREKEEIKLEKEETKREKEEIKQEKEEIKLEKEEIKLEKEEIKLEKEEIKREKEEIKREKKETKREKKETKQEKEEIKLEKEETKREKEETKREKKEIKREKEEIKREKEEIKLEKEEIRQTMEEVKRQKDEEIRQLKENIEDLNGKIADYQLKNNTLNDENADLQNYIGKATTYSLSDDDRNHSVQFVKDIKDIQIMIENYVGKLKPKVEVNIEEINKLLRLYNCQACVNSKDSIYDTLLMKGALQRYVFELITKKTNSYTDIEYEIATTTNKLTKLLTEYLESCDEASEITKAYPIKMRQQIFGILGNLVFADSIKNDDKEHPFILSLKNELNDSINKLRIIQEPNKSKKHNDMATNLIREVIRMLYFRFKVQEPPAAYEWFSYNEKIDPHSMEGRWDDDIEEPAEGQVEEPVEEPAEGQIVVDDKFVELCTFPLISTRSNGSNAEGRNIYTRAKVIHRIERESNYSKNENENEANNNSAVPKNDKIVGKNGNQNTAGNSGKENNQSTVKKKWKNKNRGQNSRRNGQHNNN